MTPLGFELNPSPSLAAAFVVIHASAAGCAVAVLDGAALGLILVGVVLSAVVCTGEALRLWPASVVRFELNEDGSGRWEDRRGRTHSAARISVSYAGSGLVILGLSRSRFRTRWLVLPRDATRGEGHRKLRLWARWHPNQAQ